MDAHCEAERLALTRTPELSWSCDDACHWSQLAEKSDSEVQMN